MPLFLSSNVLNTGGETQDVCKLKINISSVILIVKIINSSLCIRMCEFLHLNAMYLTNRPKEQAIWHRKNTVTNLTLFSYFNELLPTTQTNWLKVTENRKCVFVSGLLPYVACLPVNVRYFTFAFGKEGKEGAVGEQRGLCLRNQRQIVQPSLETLTNQGFSISHEYGEDLVFIQDITFFFACIY